MSTPVQHANELDAVKQAAAGAAYGVTRVASADAVVRYDDGDDSPFVLLFLKLAPPPAGADTWPVADMYELRQLVRRRLADLELDVPVRMSYVDAESDEQGEPGGADDIGAAFGQPPPGQR